MTKAAVSLISLEARDIQATSQGMEPALSAVPASKGLLAALVYDSLGDLLSQVQDGFQPVQLHRAASANEVMALVQDSDTALLFGEVMAPDDAFELLLALRQLKSRIESGQIRVFVHCTLPSKTFHEKLRAYGCTEVVSELDHPETIVQKARMMAELLLFRRAVSRLPGGRITSIGLAFMMSEWISQYGIDYTSMAHLFCACLSAACGGARFEFWAQQGSSSDTWDCVATSDSSDSRWMNAILNEKSDESEVRIEWIGSPRKGALICSSEIELTTEQERLLQAAADLAVEFTLLDQPKSVLKSCGLKY
jgi:hypothetical protein